MSKTTDAFLGKMDIRQKVGQMLCYGFCGTFPHQDIMEVIERYHPAGFRVTPYARKFVRYLSDDHPGVARVRRQPQLRERFYNSSAGPKRCSAAEYAEVLNTLRRRSLDTGAGVPLYFSLDFEGNGSADFLPRGAFGVPHPMGLAAGGDPSLARRVGFLTAGQLKPVGIDWVHSPCVDVNTDPANPEIGMRSYAPLADVTASYAAETIAGYREGGLVATAKHFPGRGHSALDAHHDVPIIDESADRMRDVHLAPYRALIKAGLPAVMLAHSVYPALDDSQEVSTLSKPIVTGVLREELGFDGVIVTDSFTMGGLVARYEVAEAAVRAIEAGVDVILLKDENALRGEVYDALLQAVESGRISESRVDESVRRVLRTKDQYGLLSGEMGIVDPSAAEEALTDPRHKEIAVEAAQRSTVVLRGDGETIPLPTGSRVLVIEQPHGMHKRHNNAHAHCGSLYEALLARGVDALFTDYDAHNLDRAWDVITERASHADVIVHTGWYNRGSKPCRADLEQIESLGKPTVLVCNCPYPMLIPETARNVVVTFNPTTESMNAAADVITGRTEPRGKLHFDPMRTY
ncbi:MAG: glycoside hydrolase family 3 N-terminal domain-containing protein [Planctomycetota bacterium]